MSQAQTDPADEPARGGNAKAGGALVVAAFLLAVLIHEHPENLRASAWVAYAAAGVLGLAGLCLVAPAVGQRRAVPWLVCLLLAGLTAIPGWIALGGGTRQCASFFVGMPSAASEPMCRSVFGLAAVVLALMLVLAVRGALRKTHAR